MAMGKALHANWILKIFVCSWTRDQSIYNETQLNRSILFEKKRMEKLEQVLCELRCMDVLSSMLSMPSSIKYSLNTGFLKTEDLVICSGKLPSKEQYISEQQSLCTKLTAANNIVSATCLLGSYLF